jgi:peptide deformylase
MKLPLAYYGNPILRQKGERVEQIDDELHQLVVDMQETMLANNGVGLAAQQINRKLLLFITQVPQKVSPDPEDHQWVEGPLRVFINPKILDYSEKTWTIEEGCLSIPGVFGEVERPIKIKIEATDLEGNRFEEEFAFMAARAILHENDHIHGVLFIDRLERKRRQQIEMYLQQVKKKYTKK